MRLHVISAAVLLAACVQPVTLTPVATGGSKADGIVEMSFDVAFNQSPTINWDAAGAEATKRCAAWGYTRAEGFDGLAQRCNQFGTGIYAGSCMQGTYTRTYQCLSD